MDSIRHTCIEDYPFEEKCCAYIKSNYLTKLTAVLNVKFGNQKENYQTNPRTNTSFKKGINLFVRKESIIVSNKLSHTNKILTDSCHSVDC